MNRLHLHEMHAAINQARQTLDDADRVSTRLAQMLVGRLRHASKTWEGREAIEKLKRELRDFNMTTGEWRDG